jgi:hypothetical protein
VFPELAVAMANDTQSNQIFPVHSAANRIAVRPSRQRQWAIINTSRRNVNLWRPLVTRNTTPSAYIAHAHADRMTKPSDSPTADFLSVFVCGPNVVSWSTRGRFASIVCRTISRASTFPLSDRNWIIKRTTVAPPVGSE